MAKTAPLKRAAAALAEERGSSVDLSILESKLGFQVRILDRAMSKDFVHDVGMTPVQFSVYSLVATNPNLSQVEIGEALRMDRASTMAIVHKLEGAGLLRRSVAAHDKRMHALQLTAVGKRKFPGINNKVIAHEEKFFGRLTPGEQSVLFCCLGKIMKGEDFG